MDKVLVLTLVNGDEHTFYGDEAVTYEVVRKPLPEGKKRKIILNHRQKR